MHDEGVQRPDLPWRPWGRGQDTDTTTVPEGFRDPDRFGRMRPTVNPYAAQIDNNPMRGANIGGGWNLYEGRPKPRNRWAPMDNIPDAFPVLSGDGGDMSSGEYLASRYGGGLDDAFAANDGARGMVEDAGFEVAGLTTDDRAEKRLWAQAVNSLPIGTSDVQVRKEHERLKRIYYENKYGGGGGTSYALPIG